jgi:hypothetical protein
MGRDIRWRGITVNRLQGAVGSQAAVPSTTSASTTGATTTTGGDAPAGEGDTAAFADTESMTPAAAAAYDPGGVCLQGGQKGNSPFVRFLFLGSWTLG